jgi:thiopurine S-methyltransferase
MDAEFWHGRWKKRKIGFHEGQANALLVRHFHNLSLAEGHRVFLPLCGKTRDIGWLMDQGYRVVGIELIQTAVEELFETMGYDPERSRAGKLTCYSSDNIEVFAGDFFDLSSAMLGPVDAIYDRAALVALPETMRKAYADRLTALTETAPQLLISYDYEQTLMEGPPFSVTGSEIRRLYGKRYSVTQIASTPVSGPLKEKCDGTENAWLLEAAQT